MIATRQFGRDDYLVSWHTGAPDSLADAALVAVAESRVEQPVANTDRILNRLCGVFSLMREGAEADRWQRHSIIERSGF